MEMAYLGLFKKVLEWVLSNIFDPIFKWLTNLLSTIFSWIFNEILAPILLPVLEEALKFAFGLWKTIYSVQLYTLFSGVLKLIDYIETAFDVFIGIRDVTYTSSKGTITKSLLEVLIEQETISKIFWILTIAGLGIALILTIYSTAKSAFDLDFENKRPVSKVLASMMKTFVQFFTVPFFVYFLLKLSVVILRGITSVLNGGNKTTLGRIVFMIASLNAAKDSSFNVSNSELKITLGTSSKDVYRYPFYVVNSNGVSTRDYGDITKVMEYFNLADFDYLIGFIAAIFLLFTLAVCLLVFVQRIFEVILLYIVSPYFVSTIPLDDGQKFGRWREMFVAKCFSGFGSAVGMRLYLMVCPMIMSGSIQFFESSSPEMDYLVKLLFLAGGAWAVYKAGPMITQLFSFQAGQSEAMTQAAAGGFLYAHTAGKIMTKGKQMVSSVARGGGGRAGGSAGRTAAGVGDGASNAAGAGGGAQKFNGAKVGTGTTTTWKQGVKPTGTQRSGITIGANRSAQPGAGVNRGAQPGAGVNRGVQSGVSVNRGVQQESGANRYGQESGAYKGVKLGSIFQSTSDEQGNHKVRVMGFGYTTDAAGNTTSVKLPGLKFKKTESDHSMHVSKVHLPGVVNVKSNVENGKLNYSDVSVLGMRYQKSAEGSSFRVGSGIQVNKANDGTVSHVKVGGIKVHNTSEGTGVDIGSKFSVRSEPEGTKVSYGENLSFQTRRGHKSLESLHIGKLQYSRDGRITKTSKKPGTGGDKA